MSDTKTEISPDVSDTKDTKEGKTSFMSYVPTSVGIIIVVVVLVVIYNIIRSFMNSSFWHFTTDIMNNADKVFAFADSQITKCTSSFANFFNPGSGCFLGIGLLVFGALKLGSYGFSKVSSKSKAMAKAEFLSGKTSTEIAKEIADHIEKSKDSMLNDLKEKLGRDPTKAEIDYMFNESLNKNLTEYSKNIINESSLSPENKKSEIDEVTQLENNNRETNLEDARNEGVTEESSKEIDNVIDNHIIGE